jgi:hypothetical protein
MLLCSLHLIQSTGPKELERGAKSLGNLTAVVVKNAHHMKIFGIILLDGCMSARIVPYGAMSNVI